VVFVAVFVGTGHWFVVRTVVMVFAAMRTFAVVWRRCCMVWAVVAFVVQRVTRFGNGCVVVVVVNRCSLDAVGWRWSRFVALCACCYRTCHQHDGDSYR